MTDACDSCLAALANPYSAVYMAGCSGCEIRAVSNAPDFARERFYSTITDQAKRHEFMVAVGAEYRRRKELERTWKVQA